MSRKELESMKVAELKELCKERKLSYYRGKSLMKKDELIEAILKYENDSDSWPDWEPAKEQEEQESDDNREWGEFTKVPVAPAKKEVVIDMEKKMPYIESATVGKFVAFRLPNGKVKSAVIIKKSTSGRKFLVETAYKAQHIVGYNDIVWVRSGERWPAGIYRLLKGLA